MSKTTRRDFIKTSAAAATGATVLSAASYGRVLGSNGKVRVFDPSSPKQFMEFQSVGQPVDMVWNPNGTTLAILDYMTTLQLWEIPALNKSSALEPIHSIPQPGSFRFY